VTNLSQTDPAKAWPPCGPPGLVMFEPEIATNVAALIRLAACLAVPLHLIEPLGFVMDQRRLRRIAMDYVNHATVVRHPSFAAFDVARHGRKRRLILLTPDAASGHLTVRYHRDDLLLVGRESDGVPPAVRRQVDLAVRIPQAQATRSLNVVSAATLALGEALRQTETFPTG
jgi:tRNA (cytidine/uridine-2'-O-)-methyltransferase